ncbi:MAG TPA: transketolase [bacterium]|nr:transketolase [bacterium]
MPTGTQALDQLCINTIRTLSIDAVQKANSGHPGAPMDAAPMAYLLWTRHMRYNPKDPDWPDRDRFVLSAGHASMLLYSMLHLTGYDLTLDDIKQFRQWGSRTPGHPERHCAPGVEVSTGPLGQGVGNSVGMAIAERWLAARFNRPGQTVVDHRTYVIASDGDMMEGVASEAASLAGHLRLGRLIVLYDANQVSLSGTTSVTFSEDVGRRFEAYGWHVQHVADGNDLPALDGAIEAAKADTSKPSLIVVRTHLGFGSPNKQDTFKAHGEPLGEDEVKATKRAYGWPEDRTFYIPDEALAVFRRAVPRGEALTADWRRRMDAYRQARPDAAREFEHALAGRPADGWESTLPSFGAADKPMATREASGKIMNAIAAAAPTLVGGSADLDPSTFTQLKGEGDFESPESPHDGVQGDSGGPWGYGGRNVHFGVREHAMGAALVGMAAHGGLRPYGATFLVFSDYMRPSVRLAALSNLDVLYVWTHDSVGLGEDGPTHQPIEHLASLRAIPNLVVLRPADATETVEAWRAALRRTGGPTAIVCSRQKLPVLDRQALGPASGVARGAYVLADAGGSAPGGGRGPELILIATGSEVTLALEAHERLVRDGIRSRLVSMPSWELFEAQPKAYRDQVLPPDVRARVSIEAAASFGWDKWVGSEGTVIGIDRFGASAPGPIVLKELGFTVDRVVAAAQAVLERTRTMAQPAVPPRAAGVGPASRESR